MEVDREVGREIHLEVDREFVMTLIGCYFRG